MKKKSGLIGNAAALYSALIWGTTFIVTKNLMEDFNAAEILLIRFFIAFVVLFIARLIKGREEKPENHSGKDELLCFVCGLTGLFIYGTFEILSMKYTYASNTSTIVSTNPFFIALFTILFLKEEKPRVNFFLGFLIAITGVVLISFNGATQFGLNPLGDGLALLSAASWGVYTTFVKKLSNRGYSTVYITRHTYFWGSLIMAAALPFFGLNTDLTRFENPVSVGSLLFLGIFASCTCFLTWNFATRTIGPVSSSVYIYAIPAITIIFAAILLHEKVNIISVLGIVLVVAGTVVSSLKKKEKIQTASENR